MPLRDHFRPPVENEHSWDELHGMWPAVIVQHLFPLLPEGYVAAPRVHLGTAFEIDVSTFERDQPARPTGPAMEIPVSPSRLGRLRNRPSRWKPNCPIRTSTKCGSTMRHGRRLVAAIEIVSPANKDRPESRRAFVAKVAALLQHDVCVSVVDIVTIRQFNLYADLLDLIDRSDPMLGAEPPALYAVSARGRKRNGDSPLLDTWFYPMTLGQSLPTLPIWLDADLGVFLDLEASYEATCRVLRIA